MIDIQGDCERLNASLLPLMVSNKLAYPRQNPGIIRALNELSKIHLPQDYQIRITSLCFY